MQVMKILFMAVVSALCALYLAALAWLWFQQEKLLFQPVGLPASHVLSSANDLREVTVPVSGAQLSVLHLRVPHAKGVVFFLHGNGGNLADWFIDPDFYRRANVDVVMMDYRGYGKSTGTIESEAQMHADVRAVWQHFAAQYIDKKWMLLGRSLGTALAADLHVYLTQQGRAPDATVLVSAYQSMVEIATTRYPIVPSAVLRYPLRTDQSVAQIKAPLWLVHGAADTFIAPGNSNTLKALAPHAKLVLIPQAGHNDLQNFPLYLQTIQEAMQSL
jgi:uncharacterized protein